MVNLICINSMKNDFTWNYSCRLENGLNAISHYEIRAHIILSLLLRFYTHSEMTAASSSVDQENHLYVA